LEELEQFDALAVGEAHVHEDEVKIIPVEIIMGHCEGGGGGDVKTLTPEIGLQVIPDNRVVFQDDDFFDGHV
jgi:hypothetical protein